MTHPVRIQRRRSKGSHLSSPNGLPIVTVSRPSKWGNPFSNTLAGAHSENEKKALRAGAVERYQHALLDQNGRGLGFTPAEAVRELSGKNLACWCPLDQPCHADLLLVLANPPMRPAKIKTKRAKKTRTRRSSRAHGAARQHSLNPEVGLPLVARSNAS